MSTITTSHTTILTDKRRRSKLLDTSFAIPDAKLYSLSSTSLSPGDSDIILDIKSLFICNVTSELLILIEDENSDQITIKLSKSMILPFKGQITISNPSSNPITLPVTVTYLAI